MTFREAKLTDLPEIMVIIASASKAVMSSSSE